MKLRKILYLSIVIIIFGCVSTFQYFNYGVENITWGLNILYGFIGYWVAEYILD
jgi:hypothetical protein